MNILLVVLSAIAGYLIGSFSFSITISKLLFGRDVRTGGSGNAGATNMARSFGALPGIVTLAGDVLKTLILLTAGHLIAGELGMTAAGIAGLTGHCFPCYYGFKGGKGVSAGLAVAFACSWKAGVAALAVFALVAVLGRKVSAGSIAGAAAAFITALVTGCPAPRLIMLAFAVVLIVVRHKENIMRLIKGTESDFKFGK